MKVKKESEMKIYVYNVLFRKLYDKMDQRNIVAMDLKSPLYPRVTKLLVVDRMQHFLTDHKS